MAHCDSRLSRAGSQAASAADHFGTHREPGTMPSGHLASHLGKTVRLIALKQACPPRLGRDCETERGAAETKANVILGWARLGYPTERGAVLMLCWGLIERPLDYSYTFFVPHLQGR